MSLANIIIIHQFVNPKNKV